MPHRDGQVNLENEVGAVLRPYAHRRRIGALSNRLATWNVAPVLWP